ncbi:MAG: phosphoribosylglycinamide formyltransferase [Crocinitomicaceae bacterium]|nr:phosphoribosylglycinamide formyltransferase [Crocinitomicaceae bacterium]
MTKTVKIAIFASGGGSNALEIIHHFSKVPSGEVSLVVSNNKNAGVLQHALNHKIDTYIHTKQEAENGRLLEVLRGKKIDFIVLAGYLKKISSDLIKAYPNRIVNIHPALLPKFGGKGMYGMHVHNAVVQAGESVSGPTIHYVNENYDEGDIIEQFKCKIDASDTAEDVQKKVLALEHKHFAGVIEREINKLYGI